MAITLALVVLFRYTTVGRRYQAVGANPVASTVIGLRVNLNQIAQIANRDGRVSGPTRDDLTAFLKICNGLRDHIAALVRANALANPAGTVAAQSN